jgi:hypothetical protein
MEAMDLNKYTLLILYNCNTCVICFLVYLIIVCYLLLNNRTNINELNVEGRNCGVLKVIILEFAWRDQGKP